MLFSPIDLGALLLSNQVPRLTNAVTDAAARFDNPLYKPEDPSTLTLALIGGGTLAVYLATRRALRQRYPTPLAMTRNVVNEAATDFVVPTVADEVQQPSRGAA